MILSDIELSEQQRDIVFNTFGNIVVSASAGTGKTRTMTAKIIYDLKQNKTHKVIAAITFTIKAAQEIRDRLFFDVSQNFIGTNNSFAIEEVIKPFMKDVHGDDFDVDINTDYSDRSNQFDTLAEGIQKIKDTQTIYSYTDNKKNFVFDLALEIIKNSSACRLYLQAKYFNVYIDEYQDCDIDMHNFFMYLCGTLKITTFVVGDHKQSIYRWRGANPDSFKSIFGKDNFTHKELTENHRSDKQIQDYSNLLFASTKNLVVQPQNNNNILWVTATNDDWASKVVDLLDTNKTSALLRHAKNNTRNGKQGASEGADLLTVAGTRHTFIPPTPIDDITTNSAWLYTAIASFVLLDQYSVYDFIDDIPTENDKVVVKKVEQMLNTINSAVVNANTINFNGSIKAISDFLGYTTSDNHITKLYQTASNSKYKVALNPEKPMHCALTLHSSKGLEFEQVVLFIEDYAFSGNVDESHINNHYVACTRAKSKLIFVDTTSQDANAMKGKLRELYQAANVQSNQLITIHQ